MLVAQSCPTLCNPMHCSPPGSSVHETFQARILQWVAMSFSRGSSQHKDWTQVSCTEGRFFTNWAIKSLCIKIILIPVITAIFILNSPATGKKKVTKVIKLKAYKMRLLLAGVEDSDKQDEFAATLWLRIRLWLLHFVEFVHTCQLGHCDHIVLVPIKHR